jgi:hypothetical protein
VVLGGVGTMAVVAAVAHYAPELRDLGRLTDLNDAEPTREAELAGEPTAAGPTTGPEPRAAG